jgi:hypothetical protein
MSRRGFLAPDFKGEIRSGRNWAIVATFAFGLALDHA